MKKEVKDSKYFYEFNSMSEYLDFINSRSNMSFHLSHLTNTKFYGKESYKEALDLAKHGWTEVSAELTKKLNVNVSSMDYRRTVQKFFSQAGYQAVVPLYLQGVPNNMVNQRMVPIKNKVITIVKSVGFRGLESAEKIKEESLKTLYLIKMLESMGYRINLYTLNGFRLGCRDYFVRVKVKSASEKLNISKLAFPLVHPAMLRRLNFRFREIECNARQDMGSSFYSKSENAPCLNKGELYIPSFMECDINSIKDLSDIENGLSFEDLQKICK